MERTWRSLTLLVTVMASFGCGSEGGDNGDGGQADGVFVPNSLRFGEVPAFATVRDSVLIRAQTSRTERLLRFELLEGFMGDGYRFAVESAVEDRIIPSSPLSIEFSFRAERVLDGSVAARGRFVFESGQVAPITLTAQTGVALEVEPLEVDFGTVISGRNREQTITVTNLLDRPVPVYGQTDAGRTEVEPVQGVARFDVDVAVEDSGILAPANPLAPGASLTLSVFYTADAATPDTDEATWRVGPCPDLDQCGTTLTFRGEPLRAPVACEGEGLVDGAIDVGILNPPDAFETVLTCTAQAAVRLEAVIRPGLGTGFEIFTETQTPRTLAPGDTFEVELSFEPTDLPPGADAEEADIELRLGDVMTSSSLAPVRIPLSGGHGFPVLSVQPEVIDFQSVLVGGSKSLRVVVRNDGPVLYEGVIELPDGGPFQVALPLLEIEPNSSSDFELRFAPDSPGELLQVMTLGNRSERLDAAGRDVEVDVDLRGVGADLPTCTLALSSASVDFGRIIRDQEARGFIVMENAGASDCIVNGVEMEANSDPEFFIVSPSSPSDQVQLAPGEAFTVEVGVRSGRSVGSESELLTGSFRAYTSTDVGTRSFDLSAIQRRNPIIAGPNIGDFRSGTEQCPEYVQPIQLLNGDDFSITVTDATLGGVDAEDFKLRAPMLPFELDILSATNFDVTFLPGEADPGLPSSAELRLTLGDAAAEPLIIPLIGQASGQRVVESLTQVESSVGVSIALPQYFPDPGQDIDSLQLSWAGSFPGFIAPFESETVDYRMGWLTEPTADSRIPSPPMVKECAISFDFAEPADIMGHDGRCGLFANGSENQFRSNWVAVGPATMPAPETAWSAQFQKGDSSFAPNRILRSVAASVRPLQRSWNMEVYDNDYWHFIVTQVQDDESSLGTPEFFADFIRAVRGAPAFQSIGASALAGNESSSCNSGVSVVQETPRVRAFTDRLAGGQTYSLCQLVPSSGGAQVIGEEAAGIRRRVRLSRRPSGSSIQVFADGVEIEQGGLEQRWSYDANLRVVNLLAAELLAPGTEVEVRYLPACF